MQLSVQDGGHKNSRRGRPCQENKNVVEGGEGGRGEYNFNSRLSIFFLPRPTSFPGLSFMRVLMGVLDSQLSVKSLVISLFSIKILVISQLTVKPH